MARVIVITSGKGGVGKTTCSAMLGWNLAKMGARVVLLDVDIGLNNLDIVAGIDTQINYDIVDILEGKCRIRQALIQHPKMPLLYFLPSTHSLNVGKVTGDDLKMILNELSKTFDYCIIDCPAGIGFEFHRAVFSVNEAIIVTTPHLIAVRDAGKVANLLYGYNLSSISVIVNRVRGDMVSKRLMLSPVDIARSLNFKLLGTIHESEQITSLSSISGDIFTLCDETANDFKQLALNIQNCDFQANDLKRSFLGIKRRKGV